MVECRRERGGGESPALRDARLPLKSPRCPLSASMSIDEDVQCRRKPQVLSLAAQAVMSDHYDVMSDHSVMRERRERRERSHCAIHQTDCPLWPAQPSLDDGSASAVADPRALHVWRSC